MTLYEKIAVLGPSAQYDTCGPKDFGQTTAIPGVYHAKVGGSHICRLFKVLQTNLCRHNCRYCAFRHDRDVRRATASPDEMARAFDSAWSRRLVEGLFLSSGIAGTPDQTMDRLIATPAILRNQYHYRGYLHLKVMPGASAAAISAAAELASRLSLNIESPTPESLADLSPDKDLKKGFFYTLSVIKQQLQKRRFAGKKIPSLTTQFVVGAGEETDRQIIIQTHQLYKSFGLKRVFYSAFRPVPQTPLANRPAESVTREHRLYQADFLLRFYRWQPWDIPLGQDGRLSALKDPKMIWAESHPQYFPVNLNHADYWQLLHVPGIGPRSAQKILSCRRQSCISSLTQLARQRFQIAKFSGFVSW